MTGEELDGLQSSIDPSNNMSSRPYGNSRLNAQVQDVARVRNAVARGVLIQKITVPVEGVVMVQLKDVINTMGLVYLKKSELKVPIDRSSDIWLIPLNRKLGGQALVLNVEGTRRELITVVSKLATNHPTSQAKATKGVSLGDLSKQIEVDAHDEMLDLKNTVNEMLLEVGRPGKLRGQAHLPDMKGVWLNLVRNVCVSILHDALDENLSFDRGNRMCSSLTDQVRSITVVTTAVARGDLTQKIEISVQGEMSTLKGTVNSMVDQLSAFASEVTRIALEVGMQSMLNVSKNTSNLANQVRSISEVTKAIALGDLGKFVNVDVQGDA
ncbi:hypothetical protein BYT27DRAFT_7253607 [Phlegmacium glaucopus]|nr:hypothetical protein BYT27DRAFT_7253607 [Phlegmacium glaucopus]